MNGTNGNAVTNRLLESPKTPTHLPALTGPELIHTTLRILIQQCLDECLEVRVAKIHAKRMESFDEEIASAIMEKMPDAKEIAKNVDASSIADFIESSDIAECFSADEIAYEMDASDVAGYVEVDIDNQFDASDIAAQLFRQMTRPCASGAKVMERERERMAKVVLEMLDERKQKKWHRRAWRALTSKFKKVPNIFDNQGGKQDAKS